ncbi:MAG: acyl-[acyl-carrier-protein]-phospholipid O-acyltransferase [Pseudoalteromonas tetraodonis]|jgi:acyl-[acyl-carrier-protein]-phospholipid O-acyltransferase/long-chain-fatty-acid--[acyl-carrier-protein] ligase
MTEKYDETLPRSLVRTAKLDGTKFAFADSSGAKVTFGEGIAKAIFLTGRLAPIWAGQEKVGILVPPSVGGALVNWAALLMGKVPVNLNYTLSPEGIASCIEQCGLTDIVVSGKLMERLKLELPVRVHVLEELVEKPRLLEKLRVAFLLKCCSAKGLLKRCGSGNLSADDLATVIFSSGSTGAPKGVMLSHQNLAANVRHMDELFKFTDDERMLGVLPFFHSFGFVATIAGPAVVGFGAVFHFNPMESKVIGPLIQQHRVTFMVATPTFLQFYVRSCKPEQLASLQHTLASAEKLPERLATAFDEKFGCRPREAYGSTECLAVTANSPAATRPGSIGRPLPGVELRVVNPDSGEETRAGEEGLLLVKGASVMQAYLGLKEKTDEVLRDGWYNTGDIVRIDADGYVWIAGRLSRFSKIGGEMVPHGSVEEKLHELAGITEQVFAVAGVPDEKKGERLVILHSVDDEVLDKVMAGLGTAEIPNLWKPKRGQFVSVEALPYLGTGKLDLKGIQRMASAAT